MIKHLRKWTFYKSLEKRLDVFSNQNILALVITKHELNPYKNQVSRNFEKLF